MNTTSQKWTPRHKTHGLSETKFYRTYHHMRQRCENPKMPNYHKYGGKGIRCEWRSFEDFMRDMYASYQAHIERHGENNTTIDRIDSNGDYCKANCRWATYETQNNNRKTYRNAVLVERNGETKSLDQWAIELGLSLNTVRCRYYRMGWSAEESLLPPHAKRHTT
jgi:hypothetical protein